MAIAAWQWCMVAAHWPSESNRVWQRIGVRNQIECGMALAVKIKSMVAAHWQ
jgi:hypothetical protein